MPERLNAMKIGEGFLTEKEKALFVEILYDYEGAIAFDDSEMGVLNPEIEPPGGHSYSTSRTLATTEFAASKGDGGESYRDCEGKTKDGIVGVLLGTFSESILSCSEEESRRISTHQ